MQVMHEKDSSTFLSPLNFILYIGIAASLNVVTVESQLTKQAHFQWWDLTNKIQKSIRALIPMNLALPTVMFLPL